MVACARSASSVKTSMSLSRIFKRISCGSPGMMGTCGMGDIYGRLLIVVLDDEAIGRERFG